MSAIAQNPGINAQEWQKFETTFREAMREIRAEFAELIRTIQNEFPQISAEISAQLNRILNPKFFSDFLREIRKTEIIEEIQIYIDVVRITFSEKIRTLGNCRLFFAIGDFLENPNEETRNRILKLLGKSIDESSDKITIKNIFEVFHERSFRFDENHAQKNISDFIQKSHFTFERIQKLIATKAEKHKPQCGISTIEISHNAGCAPRALFWNHLFLGIYNHKTYEKMLLSVKDKRGNEEIQILSQKTKVPIEMFSEF